MKNLKTPAEPAHRISRRNALLGALKSSVATVLLVPAAASAERAAAAKPEVPYLPENDYPFFGGEPPEGY